MRRQHDVGSLDERAVVGLLHIDVDRCARDLPRLESRDERVLVEELAARGVDDAHAVAHLRDRVRVDRIARLVVQRQVQGQEIGLREHLVELRALDPELAKALDADERVVCHDLHLQPRRAARDLAPDAAETEDAERLVGELDTAPLRAFPAALPQRGVRLRDVPRQRDEQADRVLGRGNDVRLRCVGDDDAAACRRVDVHVVDAHPRSADDAQLRRRLDQLCSDLRRGADDQRVGVVERRFGVDDDVEATRAQQLDPGVRDRLADDHLHACTAPAPAKPAPRLLRNSVKPTSRGRFARTPRTLPRQRLRARCPRPSR